MPLTIGKLADASGVGIETIRFYEKKGLIPSPPRTHSGYRQYPEDAVGRVRFILHAKELGFSLAEIGDLLALQVTRDSPCGEVQSRAEHRIQDMDEKIASLRRMKKSLQKLVHACETNSDTSECPILESLSE